MLLVIDRKETTVRYAAGTLRLEQPDKRAKVYPVQMLEQVVVYGNPLVESAVWRALADAGVPATLVDVRGKQQSAFLGAGLATQLPTRRMQHRCADEAGKQLVMARYFVQQKLLGYALPLQRLETLYAVDAEKRALFARLVENTLAKLPVVEGFSSLMGLEGQVAAAWFALLREALGEAWGFDGRNRQPPRDPVNALLSLGYTLMLSEVRHAVLAGGFDASLGFLHQDYPGRESLALDVLEIFRASVDAFVLEWLAATPLEQGSFYYREEEGCRLSKEARPLFYGAWATFRQDCPRPFPPADTGAAWGQASLGEIINGQVMRVREVLKTTDASPNTRAD
jgi:CRISPR-associated protein Cas1